MNDMLVGLCILAMVAAVIGFFFFRAAKVRPDYKGTEAGDGGGWAPSGGYGTADGGGGDGGGGGD